MNPPSKAPGQDVPDAAERSARRASAVRTVLDFALIVAMIGAPFALTRMPRTDATQLSAAQSQQLAALAQLPAGQTQVAARTSRP